MIERKRHPGLTQEVIDEIQEKIFNGIVMTRIVVPNYTPGEGVDDLQQALDTMWPKNVDFPSKIVVDRDVWDFSGAYNPVDFFPDRDADYGDGPTLTLTMRNGAELVIEEIDPSGQESALEEFRGDWAVYTGGDDEISNAILDCANEVLARSTIRAENLDSD